MEKQKNPNPINMNPPQIHPEQGQMSQTGKTLEEVLPYLLSGEPDDMSFDIQRD